MKKKIITISIICGILALLAISTLVFGLVFRVHHTNVVRVGEEKILTTNDEGEQVEITNQQIFDASGIKNGASTLFLDKSKAEANIEQAFPYIKVLQIRIVGARTIEFRVTARHQMFYYTTDVDGFFYILDEQLKVLEKVVKTETEKVENLVEIKPTYFYRDSSANEQINYNVLGTNSNTKPGDFLAAGYKDLFNSLFVAMYKTVLVNADGSLWLNNSMETKTHELLENGTIKYIDRADFSKVLSYVKLDEGYTKTKSFVRLELKTKAGVSVVIDEAESDLENKINNCFSFVSMLDNDVDADEQANENTTSTSGKVVWEYDENGAPKVRYYAQKN